jgi:UDP-glucose 4-epimerase
VLEVIKALEQACGHSLPVEIAPRRPGDISASVADNQKILTKLGWKPRHDNLDVIVKHALAWEKSLD